MSTGLSTRRLPAAHSWILDYDKNDFRDASGVLFPLPPYVPWR